MKHLKGFGREIRMTYETGPDGVLAQKEINRIWRQSLSSGDSSHHISIAEAQHKVDIEVVKAIKNPWPTAYSDLLYTLPSLRAFEVFRGLVLKALGSGTDPRR